MRQCRICKRMRGVVTETVIAGKRGYLCHDTECRTEHNTICPNCGHHWNAHSNFIENQERICEEILSNGYRLRIFYTESNNVNFAQAYEDDLFVCQHRGEHAIRLCKQSITRRIKADRGELAMPAAVHTPKSFLDDVGEDW